ncbi:apyrase-like [Chironomus tepperi]|uniref:apyrase-like n=1 Tax=Chironomus tepperi TaxID=113505 RepID=UPI00391F1523
MKFVYFLLLFISGIVLVTLSIILAIVFTDSADVEIELSLIHINDFHARFEETNNQSLPCLEGQQCIGGYARMATVVRQLQRNRDHSIFLNAADNFQGTVWYSLFRYNVTAHFLNLLPADAITIGNHEFAHNVEGLVPLLRELNSPVVAANIDDSNEPQIQNLYRKSVVIVRRRRRIGIIGAIYRRTSDIAMTGRLRFTDEVQAIREEAQRLKNQGINIIIALTHCGLTEDTRIAEEVGDLVDIVVGGHSHSFLFNPQGTQFPGLDTVTAGPYPIVVHPRNDRNRQVLVVQAFAFARYVGDLRVVFDINGNVKRFRGNPIYLGPNVAKDPQIEAELVPWRERVNESSHRVIGSTNVDLMNSNCWAGECALGSFTVDGIVAETQLLHPELVIRSGFIHAGGMRTSFPIGPITYGDVMTFFPFGNTFDILELNGTALMAVFEHAVARSWSETEFIPADMLQISGIQVTINRGMPSGSRVVSLRMQNENNQFEDVILDQFYEVVVPSFLAHGGDGFVMIPENKRNHRTGMFDVDLMESHVERMSPINYVVDGRIVMMG